MNKIVGLVTGIHARIYKLFSGKIAGTFNGSKLLLLTTKGKRSGKLKTTPLVYANLNEDEYIIAASMLGAPKNPGWYHNILANDRDVYVQIGAEKSAADVRILEGEERDRAWAKLPDEFDGYQNKTTRRIPVISLQRRT